MARPRAPALDRPADRPGPVTPVFRWLLRQFDAYLNLDVTSRWLLFHAGEALRRQAYAEAVDGYFARHRVKPGITGWAQINGWRGETDTHEKIQKRVEHDLYYIENWSVLLDLLILARTPVSLLKTENAY